MSVSISVVIPAYNESERLPPYLARIKDYFADCPPGSFEVIVVNDGSTDDLDAVVTRLTTGWPELRLLSFDHNRGKGAAVRAGMLAARGELLLFADADGATPIADEGKLRQAIAGGADVAIGSRNLGTPVESRCRVWYRDRAGRFFAWLIRRATGLRYQDCQCGFKMFRRAAGVRLCRLCVEAGYLLDVELLLWADRLGYTVAEVPVSWTEVPGSKVSLLRDGWRMAVRLREVRALSRRPTLDAVANPEPAVATSAVEG